jgi:kumamolisin
MNVRARITFNVLAAVVLLICGESRVLAQAADDGLKRFNDSIVPVPPSQGPHGPQAAAAAPLNESARNKTLQLHFGLASQNIEDLKARVAKGEIVSPDELSRRYSGNAENAKKLTAWLSQQGFTSIETTPDNTSVYAQGTVAQIEKSLGVTMKSVTVNRETMPAATTAPALPSDIGDAVIAIDGLQPWIKARKYILPRDNNAAGAAARSTAVPRPQMATNFTGYRVKDILKAYNADRLEVAGQGQVTGKGQTIAILIDTFPWDSDLESFWQENGLAVKKEQIQLINVQGEGTQLPLPNGEETLDVEWASGIAPGANVRVYAAGSLNFTALDRALDMIFLDAQKPGGFRQLSISLGLREDKLAPDELEVESAKFLKLAALGVTVFVSSGDDGSYDPPVVEYQTSDPWVISVGGTSLELDPHSGRLMDEDAWKGSGGGVSQRGLSRPMWQSSYPSISSPLRLVPDVSAAADPQTGAFLILNNVANVYGGTSWATPVWAGFAALIAEAREKQGKEPRGFLAPTLYKLPADVGFRDITSGSNGAFQAGPGWDPVTGLGVPDVRALIQQLQ